MVREIADKFSTARHVSADNWYPNHFRQDVCPKGHKVTEDGFDHSEVTLTWDKAWAGTKDTLIVAGDRENSDEADVDWTVCRKCWASWPNTGVDYE
jgi:hypothetical protein